VSIIAELDKNKGNKKSRHYICVSAWGGGEGGAPEEGKGGGATLMLRELGPVPERKGKFTCPTRSTLTGDEEAQEQKHGTQKIKRKGGKDKHDAGTYDRCRKNPVGKKREEGERGVSNGKKKRATRTNS